MFMIQVIRNHMNAKSKEMELTTARRALDQARQERRALENHIKQTEAYAQFQKDRHQGLEANLKWLGQGHPNSTRLD